MLRPLSTDLRLLGRNRLPFAPRTPREKSPACPRLALSASLQRRRRFGRIPARRRSEHPENKHRFPQLILTVKCEIYLVGRYRHSCRLRRRPVESPNGACRTFKSAGLTSAMLHNAQMSAKPRKQTRLEVRLARAIRRCRPIAAIDHGRSMLRPQPALPTFVHPAAFSVRG